MTDSAGDWTNSSTALNLFLPMASRGARGRACRCGLACAALLGASIPQPNTPAQLAVARVDVAGAAGERGPLFDYAHTTPTTLAPRRAAVAIARGSQCVVLGGKIESETGDGDGSSANGAQRLVTLGVAAGTGADVTAPVSVATVTANILLDGRIHCMLSLCHVAKVLKFVLILFFFIVFFNSPSISHLNIYFFLFVLINLILFFLFTI